VEGVGSPFVEALVSAPAGVALLARLEAEHRPDVAWFDSPVDSDPGAVGKAARSVGTMSFGRLVKPAVEAAESLAGPWTGDAPGPLVGAYRHAVARRPIAEAINARFAARLHAPVEPGVQQWWDTDHPREGRFNRRLFRHFDHVYGNGEFTEAGLWTASDPPAEAHDALISTWEMFEGPISRWHLPVRAGARVWEVHRPDDWVRLVEAYPKRAIRAHSGWELPGPNQRQRDIGGLLTVLGQHAVRAHVSHHLLPDWAAVAADYDGVHLSWAGFLTTEGYVCDLDAVGVTMLRYWGSERTHWLADVFGDPVPLGAPVLSGSMSGALGVDVGVDDARRTQDLDVLTRLLGR
jgi:hypothetical protein